MHVQSRAVIGIVTTPGTQPVDDLLPAWSEIPEEFKRPDGTKWNRVVSDWFFYGLRNVVWTPRPGVDASEALARVETCVRSWQPRHEHKEAGCAYLLSECFADVSYETARAS